MQDKSYNRSHKLKQVSPILVTSRFPGFIIYLTNIEELPRVYRFLCAMREMWRGLRALSLNWKGIKGADKEHYLDYYVKLMFR